KGISGPEGEKSSLYDFLPENVIWWVKDPAYTLEIIGQMEEKYSSFLAKNKNGKTKLQETSVGGEEEKEVALSASDFLTAASLGHFFNENRIVSFGVPAGKQLSAVESFVFDTIPQPVFNRKFELLIKDLRKYASDRYALFIFAENPKQLSRIQAIFEDLDAPVSFYQVPVPISKGFIDHQHKFLCYTDHQIFQRYHKYKVKQAYSKNKALTMKTLRE